MRRDLGLEAKFYGLGIGTYSVVSHIQAMAFASTTALTIFGIKLKKDNKIINSYNNKLIIICVLLIINEYIRRNNSVHYLSCQAVRRTGYLNFYYGRVLKGLVIGLRTYGLGTGLEGPGLEG